MIQNHILSSYFPMVKHIIWAVGSINFILWKISMSLLQGCPSLSIIARNFVWIKGTTLVFIFIVFVIFWLSVSEHADGKSHEFIRWRIHSCRFRLIPKDFNNEKQWKSFYGTWINKKRGSMNSILYFWIRRMVVGIHIFFSIL